MSATGREHASTGAYVQPDQNDAPIMSLPHMPHLAAVGWNHRDEMVSADKGGGGIVYFTARQEGV